MSTVFHLIRHAAHDQLGKSLTGRMEGVQLSEHGRRQAETLALRLSQERLDAIRTSPRARARKTAEAISEGRGIAVEAAEELDEIDFGRWTGQSFDALDSDPDWRKWNERRGIARTPGGESMGDVADRLSALMEALHRDLPVGAIALVSHSDVIKACVCRTLGLPFERIHQFEVDPASVTTIIAGDWGAKLLCLNETFRASPPGAGG